jgi:hypothetical protein
MTYTIWRRSDGYVGLSISNTEEPYIPKDGSWTLNGKPVSFKVLDIVHNASEAADLQKMREMEAQLAKINAEKKELQVLANLVLERRLDTHFNRVELVRAMYRAGLATAQKYMEVIEEEGDNNGGTELHRSEA